MTTTTWDPSELSNVTLDATDLIATATSSSGGARGLGHQAIGKYYFEVTWNTFTAGDTSCCGVANASWNLTSTSLNSSVYYATYSGGQIATAGTANTTSAGLVTAGQTVGVAVDLINKLIWFRIAPSGNWNGSTTANPATATGGYSISALITSVFAPIYPCVGFAASGDKFTANFGGSAFSGTVPSGFTSGWPSSNTYEMVTQVGAEVWVKNPSAMRVTQVGSEVWRSVANYVAPVITAEPIVMILA
jgi:hypothetical protein